MLRSLLLGDVGRQRHFRDGTATQHSAEMSPCSTDARVVGAFHHSFDDVEGQTDFPDAFDLDNFRQRLIDDQLLAAILGALQADPVIVLGYGNSGFGVAGEQETTVREKMFLVRRVLGQLADSAEGHVDVHAVAGPITTAHFLVTEQVMHGRQFGNDRSVLGFLCRNRNVNDSLLVARRPKGFEQVGGGGGRCVG